MEAFGPLLGKLNALLADECARLQGVRREIRLLRSELTTMHAALQKYTMLQDPDVQVKARISVLRELAYDIEDCIDKFIHHLGDDGHHGGIKEFFRKTARHLKTLRSRRQIAIQIGELNARVMAVRDQRSSYKLDDIAGSTFGHEAMDPRLSALFKDEAHLVGIDGPRDELAKWIVEVQNRSTTHPRVLSIVGFGGLGKTTLANVVYSKIKDQFHCHALVSVSQKPDIKKIIKDMIYSFQVHCKEGFTKNIENWDEKKSIEMEAHCKEGFTKNIENWDEKKSIEKLRELLHDLSHYKC